MAPTVAWLPSTVGAQQLAGGLEPGTVPAVADPGVAVNEGVAVLAEEDWGAFDMSVNIEGGTQAPPGAEDFQIDFNGLQISGATLFGPDEFASLYEERVGGQISLADFFTIAEQVELTYRKAGYVLSFAYIPPQTVSDGIYTLEVVEGFVGDIRVEGGSERLQRKARRLLQPILQSRPLEASVLERALLTLNRMPGVGASGVLQPSDGTPGAADLIVTLTFEPVEGWAAADNHGSKYTGPWTAYGVASVNSVLKLGDRVQLAVQQSKTLSEKTAAQLSYEIPVGKQGTRMGLSVGVTASAPGFTLDQFDLVSRVVSFGIDVEHPILRRRGEELKVVGGFDLTNVTTTILGELLTQDKLRSLSVGLEYRKSGILGGSSAVSVKLEQGLDGLFGATEGTGTNSRSDGEADFTKLTFDIAHLQPIYRNLQLYASISAQKSLDPLMSTEEIVLGGDYFGRGYDVGEIAGEDGIAGAVELRYGIDVNTWWIRRVTPFAFYHTGVVWDRNTEGGRQTLASAGGGVALALDEGVSLTAQWAQPLTRPKATENGDLGGRALVRLRKDF